MATHVLGVMQLLKHLGATSEGGAPLLLQAEWTPLWLHLARMPPREQASAHDWSALMDAWHSLRLWLERDPDAFAANTPLMMFVLEQAREVVAWRLASGSAPGGLVARDMSLVQMETHTAVLDILTLLAESMLEAGVCTSWDEWYHPISDAVVCVARIEYELAAVARDTRAAVAAEASRARRLVPYTVGLQVTLHTLLAELLLLTPPDHVSQEWDKRAHVVATLGVCLGALEGQAGGVHAAANGASSALGPMPTTAGDDTANVSGSSFQSDQSQCVLSMRVVNQGVAQKLASALSVMDSLMHAPVPVDWWTRVLAHTPLWVQLNRLGTAVLTAADNQRSRRRQRAPTGILDAWRTMLRTMQRTQPDMYDSVCANTPARVLRADDSDGGSESSQSADDDDDHANEAAPHAHTDDGSMADLEDSDDHDGDTSAHPPRHHASHPRHPHHRIDVPSVGASMQRMEL